MLLAALQAHVRAEARACGSKVERHWYISISTSIFGYPVRDAAGVALTAAADPLATPNSLTLVRWMLWDAAATTPSFRRPVRLGLCQFPEELHHV